MKIGKILIRYYKHAPFTQIDFMRCSDGWVLHFRRLAIYYPVNWSDRIIND